MNYFKIFTLTALLAFSHNSYSHTVQGHIVITQMAMNQLTKSEQEYFEGVSSQLLMQLEEKYRKPTAKKYQQASKTALISRFPDDYKKWKLSTVFKKFGKSVPTSLKPYANKSTASWHYTNIPLYRQCGSENKTNVVSMLKKSIKGFTEAEFLKDKALMLSFITHLIGDSHQPLHSHNRFSATCESDLGGNKYCLKQNKKGKCTKSLHSLWDDAAGALKDSKTIAQTVRQFNSSTHPVKVKKAEISQWINENKPLSEYAYKTKPLSTPSKQYYQQSQKILRQRHRDAADRLAMILKLLYKKSV